MARPKSPDYAQRQQQILRSAAELFATQGYSETLLDDIARHCGIKRSTLYHYHASKHALLHSLVTWKIQDLSDKVDHAVCAESTPREQLTALIATLVQDYVAYPHDIHILNTQSHHLDGAARASITVLQERLIGHARAAIAQLGPAQGWTEKSDRVLTMLLFGMVNWIPTWYKPQGGMRPEQLVDLIVRQFIGGLERLVES